MRPATIRTLLLALLAISCSGGGKESPTEPTPPPANAMLAGHISTTGTNAPITGAVVRAQGKASTTTNDGQYTINDLRAESTLVTVERSGYETHSQTVTLRSGTNTLNVGLSQSTGGTSVQGNVKGLYPHDGTTHSLSGAVVTIAGKNDTTDAAGNFQLPTIPEGNQNVTVSLPGWREYAQSFFISSTNRTLTIDLVYALPNLRNISLVPEWQVCAVGCDNSWNRAFTARLRPASSYESGVAFTIDATYEAYALINGRTPSLTDRVRRGREFSCSSGYCDQPPGITPTPGIVHEGNSGTNSGPFSRWFIGKYQPPSTNPTGLLGFDVMVGYDPAQCRGNSTYFNGNDITIGFKGTLTVRTNNDVNQWTHYTIPFDINTPWMTAPNSTFCNQ